jgi:hypothetical protein
MSTTFAIIKNKKRVKVAHRYSLGGGKVGIKWLDIKLPDALEVFKCVTSLNDVKVTATDNTAQGVKTIRDLIKLDKNGTLKGGK